MAFNFCDHCYNPNKEEVCVNCERNPNNPRLRDYYIGYPIYCPFGYEGCIHDPGYIWRYHREWFISMYGDIDPSSDACACSGCDGDGYDDEDK